MISLKKVGLISYQFSKPLTTAAAEEKAAVAVVYRRRRLSFNQIDQIKKYGTREHLVAAAATNLL